MGAPAPTFIPSPFAIASGQVNFPIPATPPPAPPNAASWSGGFPAITMQTEISGGLPPNGQDFNGILLTLTSHTYAAQAGQPYGFSASFAGVIAGYNAGAILGMADGSGLWMSITGGNITDPDNDGTAAGWVPGISYGITTLPGLTGGSVTLAPSKSRKPVIRLQGALVGNLTVILPAQVQQWLIVNSTTGGFTTTVKTAAGTGLLIPQGGPASPTGVWCDGVNIYQTQAPLAAAIDQAATPLTILQRDNTGRGFLTRLNQSSAPENPTIGYVGVMNTGVDGFLRWISLANFKAQINPSSIAANGWRQNPDGTIEQWGSFTKQASAQGHVVAFPRAFPANCFVVNISWSGGISYNSSAWAQVLGPISLTQFQVNSDDYGTGSPDPVVTVYWRAFGR